MWSPWQHVVVIHKKMDLWWLLSSANNFKLWHLRRFSFVANFSLIIPQACKVKNKEISMIWVRNCSYQNNRSLQCDSKCWLRLTWARHLLHSLFVRSQAPITCTLKVSIVHSQWWKQSHFFSFFFPSRHCLYSLKRRLMNYLDKFYSSNPFGISETCTLFFFF